MGTEIEIWFPNYGKNPGITSKLLKQQIQAELTEFDIKVIGGSFKDYETFQVEIELADPSYFEYIVNTLKTRLGSFVDPLSLQSNQLYIGRLQNPGKVGFGIFADIGIRTSGQETDALIPLYHLRDSLDVQGSCKEIIRSFGLIDGFSIPLTLTEVDRNDDLKVSAEIAISYIEKINSWLNDDVDRLIITKQFPYVVENQISELDLDKYISSVEPVDPLTTIIVCDQGTRGSGIVPKLGSHLDQSPIGIFSPSRIQELK